MSTIATARVTPAAAPPAIAAIGTREPPPEDAGTPVEPADPVENTVSVTTCTPLAGVGVCVGRCGAMSIKGSRKGIKESGGYIGTKGGEGKGFRRTGGARGLNLKEHNSRGKGGTGQPHAQAGWRTYYIACVGVDEEPGIDSVSPLGRVIKSRVVRVPREEA